MGKKHLVILNEFTFPGPGELQYPREPAEVIEQPLSVTFENLWRMGKMPKDWK